MTLEAMDLHFNAVTQLHEARDRLASMCSFLQAQNLDGMPRSSGAGRKVEQLSLLIAQQEDEVSRFESIVQRGEPAIKQFINTIQDNRIKQIFSLRFLCGFTWAEVAEAIGGKNTEGAVKAVCYRYLGR